MPEPFPEQTLQRDRGYHRERRALLLVSLGTAWVFWMAFGVLGCAEGLRNRVGSAVLAVPAYLLIGFLVLGPLGYLGASVQPRAWGVSAPDLGAWMTGALGRLAAGIAWGMPLAWLFEREPSRSWIWIALAVWGPLAWSARRGPRALRFATLSVFPVVLLGWVGEGLLEQAALRGTWGVTGVSDPAAWPLLAVVGSIVALPFAPLLLAERRRAVLEEDQGSGDPVALLQRLKESGESLEAEIDPPGWVQRWLSPRPALLRRIKWVEARRGKKEEG